MRESVLKVRSPSDNVLPSVHHPPPQAIRPLHIFPLPPSTIRLMCQKKLKYFVPDLSTLSMSEELLEREPIGLSSHTTPPGHRGIALPSVLPPVSVAHLRPNIYSGCPSFSVHVDYKYKAFERMPAYSQGVAALVDHARRLYAHTNADIVVFAAQPEEGVTTAYFSQGLLNDPRARQLCETLPGVFEDAIAPRREISHTKKEILYDAQCIGSPLTVPMTRTPSRHPKFPHELAEYLDYICADSELWGGIEEIWSHQNARSLRRSLNHLSLTHEQKRLRIFGVDWALFGMPTWRAILTDQLVPIIEQSGPIDACQSE
ncbi:hypothetical protein BOTBODRAFT_182331 [Botryobasidium botryosum FD-172 SS1]|uniref:Uncharacterized protein n=1 Tax=Botryobasidium botryosum (strain FD-172 SS1) TaxID=930990 RepID=A0A067M1C2_BOTB1|nr:hypothetical protein BOTBODRAFT_182331 [Botryobasidium botryosum FD-172 SS1]